MFDPDAVAAMQSCLDVLKAEALGNLPGAQEMIEAQLRLLIISLWRLMRTHEPQSLTETTANLTQRFRVEIGLRFRGQPAVDEIARTLGVSTDCLNRAVTRAFQMTPKQMLHRLLMAEAMRLLLETDLQTEALSALLGFSDPGYFSRFFRQRAGVPPIRYRREMRAEKTSPRHSSFASWP